LCKNFGILYSLISLLDIPLLLFDINKMPSNLTERKKKKNQKIKNPLFFKRGLNEEVALLL
ncbi:MAG: hypothetical protein QXO33_04590, partial [Nitrososphaeria archaeon]